MTSKTRSTSAKRGIALITVIIITAVIAILIGSITEALIKEVRFAGMNGVSNQALNAAYTGIDNITLALEENTSGKNVTIPAPIATALPGDGWFASTYTAQVDKKFVTTGALQYFLVSATGTAGAGFLGTGPTRTLHAMLRTVPYSAYEFYSISEVNNVGGTVWYTNGQQYDGPVYSGGPMNVMYSDGLTPMFGSTVETGSTINWKDLSNGQNTAPATNADWLAVLNGGSGAQSNIATGVPPKPLPTFKDNLLVASEAFSGADNGLTQPPQVAKGLYINGVLSTSATGGPITTGIYISGDVTMYATGTGNAGLGQPGKQQFIFQTAVGTYNMTIDFGTNQTTVSGPGGATTYSGVPSGQPVSGSGGNGSIFVDGNITIAGGVNANGTSNSGIAASTHGQYTLAVPDYASGSNLSYIDTITLNRGVKYGDDPRSDSSSTDVLAMWANNIKVNDNTDATFEIDGLLLTGYNGECSGACNSGTLSNSSCGVNTCGGGANRQLLIYGSLIENVRGKLGTQVLGANGCATGFCRHMGYDVRLGSNPPPFSPTTNKYEVTAITETAY